MEAFSCFEEEMRVNENTPQGIRKVPRKISMNKLFDPSSSLKFNSGGKCCNSFMFETNKETPIHRKNSDLTYLEGADLNIPEEESSYTPTLPKNLNPPSSLKLKIGDSNSSVFKRKDNTAIHRENNDLTYLKRADLNIPEEESLYSPTLPENLGKPLIPVKLYTEEEFNKIIMAQEFFIQKKNARKCHEYEVVIMEEVKNRTRELAQLFTKSKRYNLLLSEVFIVLEEQNANLQNYEIKLDELMIEKEMLKTDIQITKDDQNNAENVFSEIHSRYENIKSMIKSCKENIELLNRNIKKMHSGLDKCDDQYKMLESQTEDLVYKATKEVEMVKKNTENEIACLTAELKRDYIKISILEDELVQAKSTNEKLGILYKDLIAKLRV